VYYCLVAITNFSTTSTRPNKTIYNFVVRIGAKEWKTLQDLKNKNIYLPIIAIIPIFILQLYAVCGIQNNNNNNNRYIICYYVIMLYRLYYYNTDLRKKAERIVSKHN